MRPGATPPAKGVDTSRLARALFSSDASLYRVVPAGVCIPRSVADLESVVSRAVAQRQPLTMRGAGTSCAGNAVGPGWIVNTSAHLTRVLDVNLDEGWADVEPGVIPQVLNRQVGAQGWRVGPDPSTTDRCTIGGMIGNNACGPRALGYGRTADNVLGLDVITGTGERLRLRRGDDLRASPSPTLRAVWTSVQRNLGVIRTEFGRFPRQISGYSLEHLLPERGFDVTRFLVGTEGTLGVVTRARIRLVKELPHRALVVLGYQSMADGADHLPEVLRFSPTAVEGLDVRIIDAVRARQRGVPELPAGLAWLFVELTDTDPGAVAQRARDLTAASDCLGSLVLTDRTDADRWWRIRADGAGYAAVALERPAHAGWEDASVPVDRLGAYLRDFDTLLAEHQLHGLPYGHFGEGCVHCRIDFPLTAPDGVARYRRFILDAARLVASYGGSMSGEHGDGRARSELLPLMYSPQALAVFAEVKAVFDPHNLLNPGVLVDPRPLDADLRIPDARAAINKGGLAAEVHRCTGVGRCVGTDSPTMCPSYRATGQEKDSTRGRARVLQEMVNGSLVPNAAGSAEVLEVLDLCLACKACASECPTGVDLARYKAEVLAAAYRGRPRPLSHYSLGWLPTWLRITGSVPGLAWLLNGLLTAPVLGGVAARLAGIDPQRRLPRFAARPNSRGVVAARPNSHGVVAARPASRGVASAGDPTVMVWVDCNTDGFASPTLSRTIALLERAGQRVGLIGPEACCGLTYTSTGQLDAARKRLRRAVALLAPAAEAGLPIIGLEPSCLAVWSSDASWLVPDEPRVATIAARVTTLAGFLAGLPDWSPPDLTGVQVIAQPHCHQQAVLGWAAEASLLARAGATVSVVEGCCGLAGSFGMEAGHREVSVAVANLALLPALSAADAAAVVLADGLSCRVQVGDLAGRTAVTFAQLMADGAPPVSGGHPR